MRSHRWGWNPASALAVALTLAFTGLARPALAETLVVKWNNVLLECIRRSGIGPPMVARAIGVTHTCGYDAWAMYDGVAVGTRLGGALRRPIAERTQANKEKAFSFAEYRALLDIFTGQSGFIKAQMASFGYDTLDGSVDPTTPSGIGNVCAKAVTDFRHHDGSNQLGDLHAGAYSDYTGYVPVNDVDHIIDPNHWQPLRFSDGHGGFVIRNYIAPHWGNVVPFALTSYDQFPVGPPARYKSGAYVSQIEEELQLNAHLDDRGKMIAEYWADGPRSELPPGHFTLFEEFVSVRDGHTFEQDVKMFFLQGSAVMDAAIAVWGFKRFYDSERPITAIRFLKAGKKVLAYVPFKGKMVINGEDWMPYQPPTFVTPPFPEYPSGHSAFSSTSAEILKRFTGSDVFGASVTLPALSSRTEPGFAPAHDVTLSWATFSEAADEAGISRRYGGIHFEQGDLDSRLLGRQVAGAVWDKAQTYFNGTAPPPAASLARQSEIVAPGQQVEAGPIADFAIAAISPNPTADAARIEYALPRAAAVKLTVFDVQGRVLATLADGTMPAGRHQAAWARGAAPAGMYFVRLQAAGRNVVRRLAVVR